MSIVLVPLFKHGDSAVRFPASVFALDIGIQIEEAEIVLSEIVSDPDEGLIHLMAQISQSVWEEKKSERSTGTH